MVPPLDKEVKRYIAAFNITSICIDRTGRLLVSRDPAGAVEAFWLPAEPAGAVLRIARADSGNIQACGVRVTEHHVMVARARASIERLDERLARAKADGLMTFFNLQYRVRRLAAREAGQGFMSYGAAEARLRRAIVDAAACASPPALVRRVFEDRRPDPQ
jgi:hypothetical protein